MLKASLSRGLAGSVTFNTALALATPRRAVAWAAPLARLLQHTDRGNQYASIAYRTALTVVGIVPSVSRTGGYWDYAVAESFHPTVEHELLEHSDFTASHVAALAPHRLPRMIEL